MKEEPMGGPIIFPRSVKGGCSSPVYPSVPAVTELRQVSREQRARNGAGSDEGRAAAGRSRPKALLRVTDPPMGYSPKMLWLPAPRLSARDPCLDSEPAGNSNHPTERTLYPSRPYSVLT